VQPFRRFTGTAGYLTNEALEAPSLRAGPRAPLWSKESRALGKTLLAQAIADSLELSLIHWPVKSTTRAQDGLYIYDTVQRLYDARFGDGDVKASAATSSSALLAAPSPEASAWSS